ncbi:MAG TPA: NUDIX domain-containing protein [Candidatus Sulfomarinibacteraceae bacterium]|nr:NUDIX domain-containing protein [Candidatus Sulfomarinibacteraceae bacterium]
MTETLSYTWDGLPVSPNPPYGAMIVVYRLDEEDPHQRQFLVLHRGHRGADFEGRWAWGPPSGARQPGEDIVHCAERELHEETGLKLPLQQVYVVDDQWPVFLAQAPVDCAIRLSPEHDRYVWLPLREAVARMTPEVVRQSFLAAVRVLSQSTQASSDQRQNQ